MRRSQLSKLATTVALILLVAAPAFAGLSDGFGEAIMFAILIEIAWYSIYLIVLIAIILLWRRGKKWLAGGLITLTLAVGVIFPLVHQARYIAHTEMLRDASILPDTLDLSGKRVLVVHSWAGCHDFCEMLLKHAQSDAIYSVTVGYKNRPEFEKTGIFSDKSIVSRRGLNASGRVVRNRTEKVELAEIDYVILLDFYGEFGEALSAHYSKKISAENVGVQFLFAPIKGAEVIRPETLKPDVLVFYQRARTWNVPTHPRHRPNAPVMDYSERNFFLGKLFCPTPNARFYKDCTVKPDSG